MYWLYELEFECGTELEVGYCPPGMEAGPAPLPWAPPSLYEALYLSRLSGLSVLACSGGRE